MHKIKTMTTQTVFQILSVLLTGLIAGLFYGYDCSIIKGLGNLPDKEYLGAFQSINRAILNPYFFLSFIGSILVLLITCWLVFKTGNRSTFYFVLAATLVYLLGAFIVTMAANVPLNNQLDKLNLAAEPAEAIRAFREKFEAGWNKWHHIRTYASILAFLFAILSLIKKA
jgi:uncharacterized membrane protein